MLSFSSPRQREVSLKGGRNGVRASSWSRRSHSGHFVDRGLSSPRSPTLGACDEEVEKSRNRARRCSFSGRECANATRRCPDTTFVKRLFFFALTQFPTFKGNKRRGSRGFRGRRRLRGASIVLTRAGVTTGVTRAAATRARSLILAINIHKQRVINKYNKYIIFLELHSDSQLSSEASLEISI